jgi:formate dehydrogenase maturation protein FdhE
VSRSPHDARHDPREVAELRALAERQPELSAAAALQIALVHALRRVQTRIATASVGLSPAEAATRLAGGQPLLEFDRIPIDWNEARLLFRQITDVLRQHDAIDAATAVQLHQIGRSPTLPDLVRRWYECGSSTPSLDMLDEVIGWSLRAFLVRTADVLQQRAFGASGSRGTAPFGAWNRGVCPVCGGEPDFACITTSAERVLICGRCQTRWPTGPFTCPFCGETNRQHITSFATPDGTYRVTACQSCRRYLKTLDGRRAGRQVMPIVDSIATLPLDAVVMQRGFRNG